MEACWLNRWDFAGIRDCGLTFFHASQNKTAFFYVGAEGSGFSLGKKSIWLTSLNDWNLPLEAFLTQVSWFGPEVRIRSAGHDLEIEWDSFPGARYQIQSQASLEAEWNNIGEPIIARTEISRARLAPTAELGSRFFRIAFSD